MYIELADCERVLLREAADPTVTRKSLAVTYALALRSSEFPTIDWPRVNTAIVERLGSKGLEVVKRRAWALYEGRARP